jgi:tetratricopeptide (TPR) repeat protein
MTGSVWRSGVVAALFALHPLHVESVAWVTERKDVLSTLFWMLTLWAYCRYAERPSAGRYGLVVVWFVLGLMSKPMLVTLPFVLLLLDWWPLREKTGRSLGGRLVWEKVPLLGLAVASGVITFLGQQRVGGVTDTATYPIATRFGNALVSYVGYLRKTIWPSDLAVYYPFPSSIPAWKVILAVAVLLALSAWAIGLVRRRPYWFVGWFWYVGTLVPVIGLVQVGDRAMADRFTYVPLIGIFVVLVWELAGQLAKWPRTRTALTATALIACLVTTAFQVRTWRNSIALFEQAVRVTANSPVAYNNLGTALAAANRLEEAVLHFQHALRINPNFAPAHSNLGLALELDNKLEPAIAEYTAAVRCDARYAPAHYNLGAALLLRQNTDDAIAHLSQAVRLRPDHADAHSKLAQALHGQGQVTNAIPHYFETVRLRPEDAKGHYNLAVALAAVGRIDEAIRHYRIAVQLRPDYPEAFNNLGLALASLGKWGDALAALLRAVQLKPDYAKAHFNLGLVYQGLGKSNEAAASFRDAERLDPALRPEIEKRLPR